MVVYTVLNIWSLLTFFMLWKVYRFMKKERNSFGSTYYSLMTQAKENIDTLELTQQHLEIITRQTNRGLKSLNTYLFLFKFVVCVYALLTVAVVITYSSGNLQMYQTFAVTGGFISGVSVLITFYFFFRVHFAVSKLEVLNKAVKNATKNG